MYAPDDTPIELGASVGWARTVRLDGSVPPRSDGPTRRARRSSTRRAARVARGPPAADGARRRSLRRRSRRRRARRRSLDRRAGIRRGDAGTSAACGSSMPRPRMAYVDLQRAGVADLAAHPRGGCAPRVDVELIPGFLWATGGYAYSTLGTPASRLSPSFGDLGGHTLGLGLEATAGGFTVTLGWSRTWSLDDQGADARSSSTTRSTAGDGPVPPGTYGGSLDQIGDAARGRARRRAARRDAAARSASSCWAGPTSQARLHRPGRSAFLSSPIASSSSTKPPYTAPIAPPIVTGQVKTFWPPRSAISVVGFHAFAMQRVQAAADAEAERRLEDRDPRRSRSCRGSATRSSGRRSGRPARRSPRRSATGCRSPSRLPARTRRSPTAPPMTAPFRIPTTSLTTSQA